MKKPLPEKVYRASLLLRRSYSNRLFLLSAELSINNNQLQRSESTNHLWGQNSDLRQQREFDFHHRCVGQYPLHLERSESTHWDQRPSCNCNFCLRRLVQKRKEN